MRSFSNILVTGGAGFIGSHVIRQILNHHPIVKVVNLDLLTYAGNLENLRDIENIDKVHHIKGDFTKKNHQQLIKNYFKSKIEVVLSDMAENTTGIKSVDSISTGELCKEAMFFAKDVLSKNGTFVSKIFMGSSFNEIILSSKSIFKEIKVFKPKSSRKDSKESFIICKFLR